MRLQTLVAESPEIEAGAGFMALWALSHGIALSHELHEETLARVAVPSELSRLVSRWQRTGQSPAAAYEAVDRLGAAAETLWKEHVAGYPRWAGSTSAAADAVSAQSRASKDQTWTDRAEALLDGPSTVGEDDAAGSKPGSADITTTPVWTPAERSYVGPDPATGEADSAGTRRGPDATHHAALAIQWHDQGRATGDAEAYRAAANHAQKAVDLTPDAHPNKPGMLHDQANILAELADFTGDRAGYQRAVDAAQQAVNLTPDGHPTRPVILNTLGYRLAELADFTGNRAGYQRAVDAAQQAVDLTPDGHPNKPSYLHTLAGTLVKEASLTDDRDRYQRAVDAAQQAVNLTPDEDTYKPSFLHTLAAVLAKEASMTDDRDGYQRAVDAAQQCVNLTPDGHPNKPRGLNALAAILAELAGVAGSRELDCEAILIGRSAVEVSEVAGLRGQEGILRAQLGRLSGLFARRGHPSGPETEALLLRLLFPERGVAAPGVVWEHLADELAEISVLQFNFNAANPQMLAGGLDHPREVLTALASSRHDELLADGSGRLIDILRGRCQAAIEQTSPRPGDRRAADLARLRGTLTGVLVEQVGALCRLDRLAEAAVLLETDLGLLARLISRTNAVAVPAATTDTLATVAEEAGGLVYLFASHLSGHALHIDRNGQLTHTELPGLDTATVGRLATDLHRDDAHGHGPLPNVLATTLAALSTGLEPITALLEQDPVVLPVGLLHRLPLQAAVHQVTGRPVRVQVSARHFKGPRDEAQVNARQPLLIDFVGHPTGPDGDGAMEPIDVAAEAEVLAGGSRMVTVLDWDGVEAITIAPADALHLTCHTRPVHPKVLLSGSFLLDPPLTMHQLATNPTVKSWLGCHAHVFANGCTSGEIDLSSPSDALGLPVVALDAGCESVVTTLWPVADAAALHFARGFYRELDATRSPRLAFAQAQVATQARHPNDWAAYTMYGG